MHAELLPRLGFAQSSVGMGHSRNGAHEGGDARREGQVKVLLGSKRPHQGSE